MTVLIPEDRSVQVNVAPITVTLSLLEVESIGPDPDDVLKEGEAFQLKLGISFGGPGAAALVPLNIPVRVRFSAESYGPGPEVILGDATLSTTGGVFSYTAVLTVASNPLTAEFVYNIAASVRVGSVAFPALANGFIAGGSLEIYNP